MTLVLKKNIAPDLKVCNMICDNPISNKLEKYELTKFLNCHSTNLLIGKPRSGKTSLLYSFFKSRKLLKKIYNNIFIFQPSNSRASMKDNIFGKLPEEKQFEELTYDNLKSVLDTIKSEDPECNNCLIFDDMTAFLKNKDTMNLFKELIFNRRHLRTTIYFLVQTWYSVPREIRRLFSNMFIFRTSKEELENIFTEVIEKHKDCIPEITKLVYDKPYQYLFVNTDSMRMFKGFDELINI
jgi:hypothetical protein